MSDRKTEAQREKSPTEEAYAELQKAFDFYNEHLFDNQLPKCMITFQREKSTMGYFSRGRFVRSDASRRDSDEIALNPEYFAAYPMIEILQTLVHEMTHGWQWHFGNPSRVGYHNNEWANKMESIGLMPSDTGRPGGKRTGQKVADYMISGGRFEKVTKKLLADGFAISWFDRMQIVPPQPNYAALIRVPDAFAVDGNAGSSLEDTNLEEEALFAAALAVPPPAVQEALGLQIRSRDENRSNREKYTCPGCAINLWGKPNLRVRCDMCDVLLEAE